MTTTMTREHFAEAARTGQDALTNALRTWGETVQTALGGIRPGPDTAPTADRLVEAWFDVAAEILSAQREFAKGLLTIGNPALKALTRVAQQSAEAIGEATEEATHDANGSATRRTSPARKDS